MSVGPAEPIGYLLGRECARGKDAESPTLPFPVGVPGGTYIAAWCRDGDTFLYANGAKAAAGTLVDGRPDGVWT
ncbi:MAG: hypothetical protein H0X17_02435 [Deltaproteobacteria bacterium]|nr:hypothetical protein [Deltaproteobacteria bacterium]